MEQLHRDPTDPHTASRKGECAGQDKKPRGAVGGGSWQDRAHRSIQMIPEAMHKYISYLGEFPCACCLCHSLNHSDAFLAWNHLKAEVPKAPVKFQNWWNESDLHNIATFVFCQVTVLLISTLHIVYQKGDYCNVTNGEGWEGQSFVN